MNMANKNRFDEDVAVHIPLQHPHEMELKEGDDVPPPYESPQVDFNSGWKDRGFAIAFWIHGTIVVILALVLGVPAVMPFMKKDSFNGFDPGSLKLDLKTVFYGIGTAAAVGALVSFFTFFLLQQCAGRLIRCSFFLLIMTYILLGVGLFFVLWPLCLIPAFFLLITLIYLTCVRKRIDFAEAHLKAGSAALSSQPSLILIAILMLLVEFLWFVFWFLMVFGIQNAVSDPKGVVNTTSIDTMNHTAAAALDLASSKPTFFTTRTYLNDRRLKVNTSTRNPFEQSGQESSVGEQHSTSSIDSWYSGYVRNIIMFIFLLSWYWGAVTFGNIAHFITACSVGRWWFTDNGNRQYTLSTSIKRAFTTNFGTICLGSLFEAIMKALRSTAENNNRKGILSCIFICIAKIVERVIGYLNEWAFIYSALTGQSFVQASRSFIDLFRKRGWTAVINDSLIGVTLGMINLLVGLVSAAAGGLITYIILPEPPEQIPTIVIASILSFLLGILMSTIITTILTSCVRTVFVCFALNPAALGATHPDHLESLSKVWHKFYPQEFAASGYQYHEVDTVA